MGYPNLNAEPYGVLHLFVTHLGGSQNYGPFLGTLNIRLY